MEESKAKGGGGGEEGTTSIIRLTAKSFQLPEGEGTNEGEEVA